MTVVSSCVGVSARARVFAAAGVLLVLAECVGFAQPDAQPPRPPGGGAAAGSSAIEAFQGSLLADPESRDGVLSLEDDPLVQEILRDDATMRAIESGDLEQLLQNPKVRALAEHPTVKGIIERQSR